MPDELLTTTQAAERLNVSRATVARWVRLGLIEAVKLPSGQYRVSAAAVAQLLRQLRG